MVLSFFFFFDKITTGNAIFHVKSPHTGAFFLFFFYLALKTNDSMNECSNI